MDLLIPAVCVIFGFIVGTLSGRFGIGGAIITIPFFRIILGVDGHTAIATALPLTIPTALAGALVFHKKGLIKYETALVVGLSGVLFSVLGAYLTAFFTSGSLMLMSSVMFFALAYIMSREKGEIETVESSSIFGKTLSSVFIGCIAGFVSGFFGIGGGAVLVPMLVIVQKLPIKKAIPTSLATMAIYAIPGSLTHYALGNVNTELLAFVLMGSIVGAHFGAEATVREEEKKLSTAFSVFLVFLGLVLLVNELLRMAPIF